MTTPHITDHEYRTSDGVNFSTLKMMDPRKGSPRHYRHAIDHPNDGDTASRGMLRGTHCMCLTPELFDRDFVVTDMNRGTAATRLDFVSGEMPEYSTRDAAKHVAWAIYHGQIEPDDVAVCDANRNTKEWKTAEAACDTIQLKPAEKGDALQIVAEAREAASFGDRTVVNLREHALLIATSNAVRTDPVARAILTHPGAMFETPMWWTDARTGLPCKGRSDIIVVFRDAEGTVIRVLVADLKTVQSTDARQMLRDIGKMLYHVQLHHYGAGVCAMLGVDESLLDYAIVAVEGVDPHDVAVHYLDPELMHTAGILRRRMLRRVAECTDTGVWPGRYPAPNLLAAPEHMLVEPTEDELAEILADSLASTD